MKTAMSGNDVCADPGNPGDAASSATAYTYDTADRLVSESTVDAGAWVYDLLGRITTAQVRGSSGSKVVNSYYANDLIASQTIDGVARQSWTLDAIGRFATYTNEAWATGGNGVAGWQEAVTKVNNYDSDADSPPWIAEDACLPDEIYFEEDTPDDEAQKSVERLVGIARQYLLREPTPARRGRFGVYAIELETSEGPVPLQKSLSDQLSDVIPNVVRFDG